MTASYLWAQILTHKNILDEPLINIDWLQNVEAINYDGKRLVLIAVDPPFNDGRTKSNNRVRSAHIATLAESIVGRPVKIVLCPVEIRYQHLCWNQSAIRDYSFNNFYVGPSNKSAYNIAKSIAAPGKTNPQFVIFYGPAGVGKTHLLNAIAEQVKTVDPLSEIKMMTGDLLVSYVVSSIIEYSQLDFYHQVETANFLLVDGLEWLMNKAPSVCSQIHNFFSCLEKCGCKIVCSSCVEPQKIHVTDAGLESYLQHSLAVELHPPDAATSYAIITGKANEFGIENIDECVRQVLKLDYQDVRTIDNFFTTLQQEF